mmetsp:Transcript_28211/g.39894  ORF Transcript_28211/g.39894 Transcript_28211/m.39894 type:complete len:166 (+) Transcript_28211:149-646(+)
MLRSLLFSPVTKKHIQRKVLRTDTSHLFRIIQDVDRYKEFLPLCSDSKILQRSDCGKYFDATLTVGFPPLFSETYVSRVTIDRDNTIVRTQSIRSQLFDSLKSQWKLRDATSDPEQPLCDVDFEVEMTVTDPAIVAVLDQVLKEVAGRQVEAFEKRCSVVPFTKI